MNKQPIIKKIFDDQWIAVYPEIVENHFDSFYDALEWADTDPKKAEKMYKKIITTSEGGHLDAILHLGLLFNDTGKPIEGNALVVKAYQIAVAAFPNSFKAGIDQLHWGNIKNRPILRAFHAYGLELMKEQNFKKAIKEFEFILKVNPGDNQGVRYLIIDCLFYLDRTLDVLKLEERYPDDHTVEFLYGKFLALYLLDRKEEAKKQLKKARKAYPYVADELVKTKHIFPADEFKEVYRTRDYGYPIGSRQQAFDYWSITQKFWDKAKGIYEFIASN